MSIARNGRRLTKGKAYKKIAVSADAFVQIVDTVAEMRGVTATLEVADARAIAEQLDRAGGEILQQLGALLAEIKMCRGEQQRTSRLVEKFLRELGCDPQDVHVKGDELH
jgi:hypothetical protein